MTEKRSKISKNAWIRLIVILTVFLLCVSLLLVLLFKYKIDVRVATVDGIDVSKGELQLQMQQQKGSVQSTIMAEQSISASQFDWNATYDGTKAIERLRKTSLDVLVEIKVVQNYCLQYGLRKDVSYKSFLQSLEEENQKLSSGNGYGVQQYTEFTYYSKLHSQYKAQLENYLIANVFRIDEEDARAYWQECYNNSTDKQNFASYESAPEQWLRSAGAHAFETWLASKVAQAKVKTTSWYAKCGLDL